MSNKEAKRWVRGRRKIARKSAIEGLIRPLVGMAFAFAGCVAGIYVGLYLMFLKPIADAVAAYDAGMLTATMVGVMFVKYLFAAPTGVLIAKAGVLIGRLITGD